MVGPSTQSGIGTDCDIAKGYPQECVLRRSRPVVDQEWSGDVGTSRGTKITCLWGKSGSPRHLLEPPKDQLRLQPLTRGLFEKVPSGGLVPAPGSPSSAGRLAPVSRCRALEPFWKEASLRHDRSESPEPLELLVIGTRVRVRYQAIKPQGGRLLLMAWTVGVRGDAMGQELKQGCLAC
jgi:hypothetical protein